MSLRLSAATLVLALAFPPAVQAAGSSWSSVNGPADGSRAVVTGNARPRTGLGGYRSDLLLWRRIERPATQMVTGDLDGDGRHEMVCTHVTGESGCLYAVDAQMRVLWRREEPRLGLTPLCADLDGDGRAEVIVTRGHRRTEDPRPGSGPSVETWDGRGRLRWSCEISQAAGSAPIIETVTVPLFADDLDGDGTAEIGVFHNARVVGPDRYVRPQRHLLLYRENSSLPIAQAPLILYDATAAVGDVNRDGKKEVFISGYAQADGGEAYGQKDNECRALLFDHALKPLTTEGPAGAILGGHYTSASLAFVPGARGQPAALAAFIKVAAPSRTDRGALQVLDPLSGAILQTMHLLTRVERPIAADVTGDAGTELLPLTDNGSLNVVSATGAPMGMEITYRGPNAAAQFATDLDGDGKMEIICSPERYRLGLADFSPVSTSFILRSRLAPPQDDDRSVGINAIPWDVDGDGICEVAATLDGGHAAVELYKAIPAGTLIPQASHRGDGWPEGVTGFEWSPDGRYVVIADSSGNKSIRRWSGRPGPELYKAPSAATISFPPAAHDSRADNQVALVKPAEAGWQLAIANLGGGEKNLAEGEFGNDVAWSADGRLLISQRRNSSMDIMVHDPQTGEAEPLAGASDPARDETTPCVAPGTDTVAFLRAHALPVPIDCHSPKADMFLSAVSPRLGQPVAPDQPVESLPVRELWWVAAGGGQPRHLSTRQAVLRCLADTAGGPDNPLLARMRDRSGLFLCHVKHLSRAEGTPYLLAQSLIGGIDRPDAALDPPWYAGEDIQLVNTMTGEMHPVTFDDDQDESAPAVSPDGHWIAYVAKSATAPEGQVIVTNLTGSSRLVVDAGMAPVWEPGKAGRLWYVRENVPHYTELRGWQPEDSVSPWTVFYAASGSVVVTGGLFAFRIPSTLMLLFSAWALAFRRASQTGQSLLIAACLRRLTAAHASLHALKNTVMFWPTTDDEGNVNPVATLEYVFDPENVSAVRRGTEQAIAAIYAVAVAARTDRTVLRELQPETGRQLLQAIDLLSASRHLIASYADKVERDSHLYAEGLTTTEGPSAAVCEEAMANLKGFYQLLTDEEGKSGLLDRLRASLREVQVPMLLQQVAAATSARAKGMGIETSIARGVNPLQYIPGDPAPLRSILVDAVANSLDSIARRQQTADEGYVGEVSLGMNESEQQFALTVTDNGAGIGPELLAQLNSGAGATTKGEGRGSGIASARRVIARYPEGRVDIGSEGEGRGAVFTVWLEKV